jgi:hypothetical protein
MHRHSRDHGDGLIANMADPFGNGFDLIEFAPGGYDLLHP